MEEKERIDFSNESIEIDIDESYLEKKESILISILWKIFWLLKENEISEEDAEKMVWG